MGAAQGWDSGWLKANPRSVHTMKFLSGQVRRPRALVPVDLAVTAKLVVLVKLVVSAK